MSKIQSELSQKITGAKQHLVGEFSNLRSGRANAGLLDRVMVDVYGQKMPLNNVATISVPEPRQLLVQPWDKSNIGAIEKAVITADLGLGVVNEGDKVRVTIPLLSNERREELVKLTQKMAEESRVAIRGLRREAFEGLDRESDQGGVSEDELERWKKDCQVLIDSAISDIDKLVTEKSEELRSV